MKTFYPRVFLVAAIVACALVFAACHEQAPPGGGAPSTEVTIGGAPGAAGSEAAQPEVSGETGAKAPAPPFNVTATPGDSQITISWAPVTDAIFYNIYWGAAAGVTTSSTKIPKISGPFIHDKLTNGTNYFYIVTAENAVGEGELSDEVSATPMQ